MKYINERNLMKSLALILVALYSAAFLAGCSNLPSMKYCDKVEYKREGGRIHVEAECTAPVGGSIPGL